jgi:hypothetical protein
MWIYVEGHQEIRRVPGQFWEPKVVQPALMISPVSSDYLRRQAPVMNTGSFFLIKKWIYIHEPFGLNVLF